MRKSNFPLRLQPSLLDEARRVAAAEGVALNQLINVAVAEKLSALRTESYIAERTARANSDQAIRVLGRLGAGHPPMPGDEIAPAQNGLPTGVARRRAPVRRSRAK